MIDMLRAADTGQRSSRESVTQGGESEECSLLRPRGTLYILTSAELKRAPHAQAALGNHASRYRRAHQLPVLHYAGKKLFLDVPA